MNPSFFTLLFFPLLLSVNGLGQSCYQSLKQDGDVFMKKAGYEKAIQYYLAALNCPDKPKVEEDPIPALIKKALNSRVSQLEDALNEVQSASLRIVDFLLQEADNRILKLDYESALPYIHEAAALKVNEKGIIRSYQEIAFFYTKSERYGRAIGIMDTLFNVAKSDKLGWSLKQAKEDSLQKRKHLLAGLEALDKMHFDSLMLRYYPEMVLVPGGTFQMGCDSLKDKNCKTNEFPVHEVKLDSYYIAKTETTVWQYYLFLKSKKKNFGCRDSDSNNDGDNPVVCMRWYAAVEYANWLSEKRGLPAAYEVDSLEYIAFAFNQPFNQQSKGYRLPTEAEWEYAARGGPKSADFIYSGSNDLGEVGWYEGNSDSSYLQRRTHKVGTLKANELGIYDMSGNVWEWCWDWYDGYEEQAQVNPIGPEKGYKRVLRGGSWNISNSNCPVANRFSTTPYNYYSNYGFRMTQGH